MISMPDTSGQTEHSRSVLGTEGLPPVIRCLNSHLATGAADVIPTVYPMPLNPGEEFVIIGAGKLLLVRWPRHGQSTLQLFQSCL